MKVGEADIGTNWSRISPSAARRRNLRPDQPGYDGFPEPPVCFPAQGSRGAGVRPGRKIPPVLGTGQFKRAHGFKIVGDLAYVTDQADNVAMIYTLEGKLVKQIGTRGQHSDTGCEDWHNLPLRAAGPFNHPTEMMPGPSGDLYVTDGYRNSRVHRFTKDGELIQSWGQPGQYRAGRISSAPQPRDLARRHALRERSRQPARADLHAGRQVHRHVDRHGRPERHGAGQERNLLSVRAGDCRPANPRSACAMATARCSRAGRCPRSHGMGIDASGNIYVGMTGKGRVNKYARMH